MNSAKPFKFSGLPSFTKEQVALLGSVSAYLSMRPASPTFAEDLAALLGKELRCKVAIDSATVATVARAKVASLLPETGCFAVVGIGSETQKIIVDMEPSTAAWCIDRLLGGTEAKAGRGQVARAPTDMESGVLSYLLLHVLAFLSSSEGGLHGGEQMALVLDRILGSSRAVEEHAADEDHVVVSARIVMGPMLSHMRALIPGSLVRQHFGAPITTPTPSAFELACMRRRLGALPEQHCVGRVIGAKLDLSSDDLSGLEKGDIIILENHALRAKADVGLSGAVHILMGRGRYGHIKARLYDEAGSARLEIQDIVEQDEPAGGEMSEETKTEGDNLPETQGLLREMDSHVAVELGRIRLTTAQVVRLRKGQVLHLSRGATDPVDLVVGSKLFGRGELLEVDGELGVRLTQLTGDL